MKTTIKKSGLVFCVGFLVAYIAGCGVSAPDSGRISEVELLYQQGQYQNALNVARYNINNNVDKLASIVVVWKVQVLQGTQSIDYVQSFYNEAQSRVKDFGPGLIPYLCRGLSEDPYNTVRLFSLYALSEFEDTTAAHCASKIFEPGYAMGQKPSNVTQDFLKSEAALILGARQYKPAFDGIAALSANTDIEILSKVAQALGMLQDPRGVPVLEEMKKTLPSSRDGLFVVELADSAIARIQRSN